MTGRGAGRTIGGMRIRSFAAACAAFVFMSGVVEGAGITAHPMDFSTIGIGMAGGYRDYGDFGKAYGGTVRLWWVPLKYFGVDFRTGYFEESDSEYGDDGYLRRAKYRLMPMEAGLSLILPLGEHFRIHGGGGLGYYSMRAHLSVSSGERAGINTEDGFGEFVCAGAMLEFTEQLWLFAEARWTWLRPDLELHYEGGKHDFDLDASGLGVDVGLIFGF